MDHETIKDQLFLYLDTETGEEVRREIGAHLETCADCCQTLKRLEQVRAGFSQAVLRPSPHFVFKVMERLEPEKQEAPAALPGFLRWLFPAAGYTFAIVLMFVVIAHREAPVHTEAILLADFPHASQWALGNQAPDAGDLIEM